MLIREYADRWLASEVARGLRVGKSYRSLLDRHILPELGALELDRMTRAAFRGFCRKLQSQTSARGRPLAPRTIRNVVRLLHTLLEAAVDDELVSENPIVPGRRDLPRMADADPAWRPGAIFQLEEIRQLLVDERVRPQTRMIVALAALTGMRWGEIAALRFSDWQQGSKEGPLSRIVVTRGYSTSDKVMRSPKTTIARIVPVHPVLQQILDTWWCEGWTRAFGRCPYSDDLLLPNDCCDVFVRPMSNSGAYQRLVLAEQRLGLRRRGPHILRATFLTLLQASGVAPEVIETITHNKAGNRAGSVVAGYTRFPFAVLCQAILKLDLHLEKKIA